MKNNVKNVKINGHEVTLFGSLNYESVIVQPVDSHDMEEMENELDYIKGNTDKPFLLAAVKINKWNDELTPWPAPPVLGKIPFGSGAKRTLDFIVNDLLPWIESNFQSDSKVDWNNIKKYLGGYSLAGLFSLWAGWNSNIFNGIVAASPSVWYKDWLSFAKENKCKAKRVYLSLGDKEWHSKNKLMATVADAIKEQKSILDEQGIENTLVWNPGNHFTDNGERTAKGFAWFSSPSLPKGEDV